MGGVFAPAPTASKNIGTLSQMSISRVTRIFRAKSRIFLVVLILARVGGFRAALVEFHMGVFIRASRSYEEEASEIRETGGFFDSLREIRKFGENQALFTCVLGPSFGGFPKISADEDEALPG